MSAGKISGDDLRELKKAISHVEDCLQEYIHVNEPVADEEEMALQHLGRAIASTRNKILKMIRSTKTRKPLRNARTPSK